MSREESGGSVNAVELAVDQQHSALARLRNKVDLRLENQAYVSRRCVLLTQRATFVL
jgi:hypothetical protein